ncbi:MAG: hypothetical protein WAR57_02275 [Candidatus Phosphoribacter sp.]|nr:hypothetical protein [Actinomycetales bacterium]
MTWSRQRLRERDALIAEQSAARRASPRDALDVLLDELREQHETERHRRTSQVRQMSELVSRSLAEQGPVSTVKWLAGQALRRCGVRR